MTEAQRQAAIDALLTVDQPMPPVLDDAGQGGASVLFGSSLGAGRRYREARLEADETVTILGQALPWADVREHLQAMAGGGNVDRDLAEDIAEARAAGELAASPEEAWGNAAIPGFGIGRPTRPPELDPEAAQPEVGDAAAHVEALERYEIPGESLVLAKRRAVSWPSTGAHLRPRHRCMIPHSCWVSWARSCRCAVRWPWAPF